MRAASFEATEDLDAEIANGKDVGKAGGPRVRAAALVVGRKKRNGVAADGRGEGSDENPTTEEVKEGGRRQRSEHGGEETAIEKRLWLWILEQRRTEAGKKKRPDERSEDDGLWKKQRNGGGEEEAGGGAGCGGDEAADEDVGRTRTVDPAGGEGVGGELGKEVVQHREAAAVLALEGEEGRERVGGDRRQH